MAQEASLQSQATPTALPSPQLSVVKVAISADFLVAYSAVPRRTQKKVREFTKKFLEDPTQASINYERINGMKDPKVRTVRVGLDYRAIVIHPPKGDVYVCVWVDHHDEAMAWARNKRFEINPQVGSFQVFEVQEGVPQASEASPSAAPDSSVARLFAKVDDATLSRLGVPELLLPSVRALCEEHELDALRSFLPTGVADTLYMVAAGYAVDDILAERAQAAGQVDLDDLDHAMSHPDSRRRFRFVSGQAELDTLLEAPLEVTHTFADSPSDPVFLDQASAPHAVEVLVNGTLVPTKLAPGECWIFGRQEDCNVILEDKRISRRHFEVRNLGDRLEVQSFPSKNPTKVLGRRSHDDVYYQLPDVTITVVETEVLLRRVR